MPRRKGKARRATPRARPSTIKGIVTEDAAVLRAATELRATIKDATLERLLRAAAILCGVGSDRLQPPPGRLCEIRVDHELGEIVVVDRWADEHRVKLGALNLLDLPVRFRR